MNILKIKKISHRMTLYFSLLLIFAFLIMLFIINLLTKNALLKQITITADKDLLLLTQHIDSKTNELYTIHHSLVNDNILQNIMTEKDSNSDISQARDLLKNYTHRYPMINAIFLFNVDGYVINTFNETLSLQHLIEDYDEFYSYIESNHTFQMSTPTFFPIDPSINYETKKNNLSFFAQYYSIKGLEKVGYVLINYRKEWLFEDIKRVENSMFDAIGVVDENNNIIYYWSKSNLDESTFVKEMMIHNNPAIPFVNEKYISFSKTLNRYNRWEIIGLMPYKIIQKETIPIAINIIFIGLLTLSGMIIGNLWISRKITQPINSVIQAFIEFKNKKWPKTIQHNSNDETQLLVDGVNNLFSYIRELLNEVQTEHEENITLQYELLQSQINPHFIHNTMNALKCIALENDSEQIASIVNSMNYLFRISMTLNHNHYTVENEIECIHHFINIMNFRYANKFHYSEKIDPLLFKERIPKFILQPIVENAIFHGILPVDGHGKIHLEGRLEHQYIIFTIQDNGIGFNTTSPPNSKSRGYGNIGIDNIKKRLKVAYDDQSFFNIKSIPNKGTIVELKFPVTRGELNV